MCYRSPMVVPKLAGNFQHNIQRSQTFFKKYTHAKTLVIQMLPRVVYTI